MHNEMQHILKSVSISLPRYLIDKLDADAKKENRSRSNWLTNLLKEYYGDDEIGE